MTAMHYTETEDAINSLTHGLGVVLSLAGLAVLVVLASLRGSAWHIVSCSVYGVSLVTMFLTSTLYHGFRSPRLRRLFRVLDHAAIYLLIAGSYTPFMLVTLRGAWGWTLFGVVWALAALGLVFQGFFHGRFPVLTTSIYVLMGWLIVVAMKPLWNSLPHGGFLWLLAGGLFYTGGAMVYLLRRIPYQHAVWHLFVLGGSACHYIAILSYVVPGPAR
ncbi:MAG: hemolysin-III related [Verrucomicrobia bacterium ADurb.Bin345]|nr:MAG: hemolysin-III related [Verrucomicrobia bacterium ADurb.Bin345]